MKIMRRLVFNGFRISRNKLRVDASFFAIKVHTKSPLYYIGEFLGHHSVVRIMEEVGVIRHDNSLVSLRGIVDVLNLCTA